MRRIIKRRIISVIVISVTCALVFTTGWFTASRKVVEVVIPVDHYLKYIGESESVITDRYAVGHTNIYQDADLLDQYEKVFPVKVLVCYELNLELNVGRDEKIISVYQIGSNPFNCEPFIIEEMKEIRTQWLKDNNHN